MSKILIVGATSAIAHETAKLYARAGAELFLVGRTTDKLDAVARDLQVRGASRVETFLLDLNEFERHQELCDKVLSTLGGLDAVLVAHGTLPDQQQVQQDAAAAVKEFSTNCTSIVSLLTILANHFEKQKRGTIAVISSVAGDRGRQTNYVYGSAKAGLNAFLEGLRARMFKVGVAVVTIKPGFVATPMTAHLKSGGPLWASAAKVGQDIYTAIEKGKDVVYTPWFWRYIMLIIIHLPHPVFKRLKL
jgi:short-subunit dehydrogenase